MDKLSADALKNYDGVIFANTTGDLPLPDKEAHQVDQPGKAFIGMHWATDTFHGYPEFVEIRRRVLTHGPQVGVGVHQPGCGASATRTWASVSDL